MRGLMSKKSNQKLKLLYLLKILMEKTDTDHMLTVPEMIQELEKLMIKLIFLIQVTFSENMKW